MALFVRMIIIAVNITLHNNIFHSNSYFILICVMCLWPGLVVDTRYTLISSIIILTKYNINFVILAEILGGRFFNNS
jgi:hypothetical protein